MITATTSVAYGDRFYITWFFFNKSTYWHMNFMILFFELVEQLYLSGFQEMFFMFFVLISCYSSSHHMSCSWWNTWIVLQIFIYYFFNIFSKSIFVWLPTNSSPTSEFIIYIYFQSKFSMFVQSFSRGSQCSCHRCYQTILLSTWLNHCHLYSSTYIWNIFISRSLNWLYSTTHIFYHLFFHFFYLWLIFEYPIVSSLLLISLMIRDISTFELELSPQFWKTFPKFSRHDIV